MWIGIVLGVIALLIIGNWIYTTVNTKNVVEYYPNGRIKLKGVTKFNERVGSFDHFDEYGALSIKMTYENGKLKKEDIVSISGGVYKTVEHYNGVISTKYFLENAPEEIRRNRSIVLEALKNDGLALRFISTEFKNDREIVLEAVKSSGKALEYASDELKNDREIVLEAVKRIKSYGSGVLKFASSELKNNKEVAFTAIQSNINQFHDVSENLKRDVKFLKSIFTSGKELYKYDRIVLFDMIREIHSIELIYFKNKFFSSIINLLHSKKDIGGLIFGILFFGILFFIIPWKPFDNYSFWGIIINIFKQAWKSFIVGLIILFVFEFLLKRIENLVSYYKLKKWLNSENE